MPRMNGGEKRKGTLRILGICSAYVAMHMGKDRAIL